MHSVRYQYIVRTLLILCFCFPLSTHCGKIDRDVQNKLSLLKPGETLPVIVHCSERPAFQQFKAGRNSAPAFIRHLKNISEQNISKIQTILSRLNYPGKIKQLWITNSLVIDVTKELADTIIHLPFIDSITEDEKVTIGGNSFSDNASFSTNELNPGWNIKKIKADSVWLQYGISGNGVLIGSMDTGIDTSHPSIAPKWRNGSHSWFDAISGNAAPYDDDGHGTHTTGTLIGGDGPGPDTNDIGIAYGATFILAKMLTSGFSSVSQVTGAAQWMLDPDGNPSTNDFPQVINNSWFSNTRGSTWFVDAAAAWRAAGIIPVFCASNFGPATSSTRSPGDYFNCLSVGGTNSDDTRYGATSVGPSPAGAFFPVDRRKPDMSAPGEGVRSCRIGGGFVNSSGTSMAAPHITGTIALMLQANPTLTYDEVFDVLKKTSVDLGTSGYDYIYGYGRIDALAAVREALRLRFDTIPIGNLITSETGDGIVITVSLRVLPESTVTVHLILSDTTEGKLTSDTLIQFTHGNWNIAQAISIVGLPDGVTDGNVSYSLLATTESSDPLYNNLSFHVAEIVNTDATPLDVNDDRNVATDFAIYQNYPNPFNPRTKLSFVVGHSSIVSMNVFNLLGQQVSTLLDREKMDRGEYEIYFNGSSLLSGVYYYRFSVDYVDGEGKAKSFADVKRMLMLK